MFLIAWRNLFGDRGRLLITISGVTFAVVLILILIGLYRGWETQMTRFTGNIDTTYWVGQDGSGDLSHSISLLPRTLETQLATKPYINEVSSFFGRQTGVTINGSDVHIFVVGIDDKSFISPYKLVEGSGQPKPGEIVIDQSLARSHDLTIGSLLPVADRSLRVVGVMTGTNILAYTFALTSIDDAVAVFGSNELINYFMVRSTDPLAKQKLERDFPSLKVMPKAEFLENNRSILTETFLPLVEVLVVVGFIIGIAVIGLTIFTATVEKSREYGVLKAIGYTNGALFSIALIQAMTAGVTGFIIGAIISPQIAELATYFASGFLYEVGTETLAYVFASIIIMSAIAALMPLKRLVNLDPALVFKA